MSSPHTNNFQYRDVVSSYDGKDPLEFLGVLYNSRGTQWNLIKRLHLKWITNKWFNILSKKGDFLKIGNFIGVSGCLISFLFYIRRNDMTFDFQICKGIKVWNCIHTFMKRTITAFIHKSNSKSSFTISENVNGRNIRKSTSTYVNVNWKTFLRVVLPKKMQI